jgi:predicted ATPase
MFLTEMIRRPVASPTEGFPWTVPAFARLERIAFTTPVTVLVGENGSGKSTLLEAIGIGMKAMAAGSRDLVADPSLDGSRTLAGAFRFIRRRHPATRLFFRAEDALGFARRMEQAMVEFRAEAVAVRGALGDTTPQRRMVAAMLEGQASVIADAFGDDPEGFSHGERFLGLLRHRIRSPGLYLLDEPETPLSPTRILGLIALIGDMVARGAQFVLSTHSPVLMAIPGARILVLEPDGLTETPWDEVEHVRLTRAFLSDPDSFLRRL